MNKSINIAVVGLGQVGSYLLNELNTKKKDIELKTGKKIKDQKKPSGSLKKSEDITNMTYEEYNIYIDDHTKKSKYPDINQ